MTDVERLAEMKDMVLDIYRRIKGDDFFIGLIEKIETSMNLVCKEQKIVANDDMVTLEKNLNALVGRLSECSNDLHSYAELISLLQVKYSELTPNSTRNTKNINNEISRFDKDLLLRYKPINKNGESSDK